MTKEWGIFNFYAIRMSMVEYFSILLGEPNNEGAHQWNITAHMCNGETKNVQTCFSYVEARNALDTALNEEACIIPRECKDE